MKPTGWALRRPPTGWLTVLSGWLEDLLAGGSLA